MPIRIKISLVASALTVPLGPPDAEAEAEVGGDVEELVDNGRVRRSPRKGAHRAAESSSPSGSESWGPLGPPPELEEE